MSNHISYVSEPPTSGKVILHTTFGDLEIELWCTECPKAARNFIQLCLEGKYDNCIFHRIVKDFIAQTGDPSGTGLGGESVFGDPFKDEFHPRLKFARRGLIGMANSGPNLNQSQFFITLSSNCSELTNRNTLFGKIVGDTIYNAISLNELECNANERPLNPPKILKATVVINPFDEATIQAKKALQAQQEREQRQREREERERQQQQSRAKRCVVFSCAFFCKKGNFCHLISSITAGNQVSSHSTMVKRRKKSLCRKV